MSYILEKQKLMHRWEVAHGLRNGLEEWEKEEVPSEKYKPEYTEEEKRIIARVERNNDKRAIGLLAYE